MNLLSPFQFHDMFVAARSFAIVGNAPTILEHENGARIDVHDVVIRFNRATTAGNESKIGSRTDILVVNANNNRTMAPSPSETICPRCIVCFTGPQMNAPDPAGFAEWVGDVPIFFTFGPDLVGLPAKHHTRPLTSGTYILLTMIRMFDVQELFVTGFTMFGAKGGASEKYYRDDRVGVGTFHDLDVEAELFDAILSSSSAKLELTPEVAALVRPASAGNDRKPRNGSESLTKRVAAGLSWRVVNLGLRLRRIAESR